MHLRGFFFVCVDDIVAGCWIFFYFFLFLFIIFHVMFFSLFLNVSLSLNFFFNVNKSAKPTEQTKKEQQPKLWFQNTKEQK